VTENTRASYPIHYIRNAHIPCIGGHPRNIILLCCDAFGVLPPVSKLTLEQAMYHFISGYTAKVAGVLGYRVLLSGGMESRSLRSLFGLLWRCVHDAAPASSNNLLVTSL
jgi:hypothetical protein